MLRHKERSKLCYNSVQVRRKNLTRLLFVLNGVLNLCRTKQFVGISDNLNPCQFAIINDVS